MEKREGNEEVHIEIEKPNDDAILKRYQAYETASKKLMKTEDK